MSAYKRIIYKLVYGSVAYAAFRKVYYAHYRFVIVAITENFQIRNKVLYFFSVVKFEAAVNFVRDSVLNQLFLKRAG